MDRIIVKTLLFLMFAGVWTAGAQNGGPSDTSRATSLQQEKATLLREAYKKKSDKKLERFFDNWSKTVSSNETEASNKYVAEAHKVYAAFYQPLHLDAFNYGEIYQNSPYFIVQGNLRYIGVTDTILYTFNELDSFTVEYHKQHSSKEVLENYLEMDDDHRALDFKMPYYISAFFRPNGDPNSGWGSVPVEIREIDSGITFRPPVSFDGRKIVYLTDEYMNLLNSFLKDAHVELGEYDIMQPAFSIKESKRRQEFINRKARIFYGHWGGYWQYETYPRAYYIIFDEALQRAVIHYRIVYCGGYAILEKRDGEWTLVKTEDTWME